LIVRANPAVGITAETVLADLQRGHWGRGIRYPAPPIAATDDGVMEFVLDCDGTAGYVNIDDWSFA